MLKICPTEFRHILPSFVICSRHEQDRRRDIVLMDQRTRITVDVIKNIIP